MTTPSIVLKSLSLASFVILAAVGCQPAAEPVLPVVQAPNSDVAALQIRTQGFAQDMAVAAFYAQRCTDAGVSLRDGNTSAASGAFFLQMAAAGYARDQIEAATAAVDTEKTGSSAVAHLEPRGLAADAETGALCKSAQDEIAEKSAAGILLVST